MPPHPPCGIPAGTDPRLHPFLEAASADAANTELGRLMELATPLIVRVARHRSRRAAAPEAEDAVSEARVQVLASLHRLRRNEGVSAAIADFEAYTCAVAARTCAEIHRRRDLERTKIVNRLLYLLQKCPTQRGFALWKGEDGVQWASFEDWHALSAGPSAEAQRVRLLTDPRAVAAEIFGAGGWSSRNLPDLVASLLAWLGAPLKFADLADVVTRLQDAPSALHVLEKDSAGRDTGVPESVDPHPSPQEELQWKEYLEWLWQQSVRLTLPQRSAFLLHSHCLHEMELVGLTSVRQVACALELAAERMAELWNALPLDDLAIGALLGVGRQQVINWRKAARIQLGRAWQQWSNGQSSTRLE